MTTETVKDILSRLSANKGKAARLETEIGKLEGEIAKIRQLEADTLKAAVSDPTGKRAVQLAGGEFVSAEEARLAARIADKTEELEALRYYVGLAEGWLGALMEREKLIITLQTVQKRSWRETAAEYKKAFGDEMSEDTLRRMRDRTIGLIAREM